MGLALMDHQKANGRAAAIAEPLASDHSLLRRFRSGSQDAATALYLRYVHRLKALVRARCSGELARRADPDDIVQSVFRRFFQKVCKGDYDVPEGEELWGLLLVIALNKIRSEETYHRSGKRDVRLTRSGGEAVNWLEERSDRDETALRVLELTIADVMARLQPHQQAMVELRVQGHDIAEIASKLGRSKRTVERNLQLVRGKLQALLA
jgi:RNA polymerase sigma-70 factor (ECF subfamily)